MAQDLFTKRRKRLGKCFDKAFPLQSQVDVRVGETSKEIQRVLLIVIGKISGDLDKLYRHVRREYIARENVPFYEEDIYRETICKIANLSVKNNLDLSATAITDKMFFSIICPDDDYSLMKFNRPVIVFKNINGMNYEVDISETALSSVDISRKSGLPPSLLSASKIIPMKEAKFSWPYDKQYRFYKIKKSLPYYDRYATDFPNANPDIPYIVVGKTESISKLLALSEKGGIPETIIETTHEFDTPKPIPSQRLTGKKIDLPGIYRNLGNSVEVLYAEARYGNENIRYIVSGILPPRKSVSDKTKAVSSAFQIKMCSQKSRHKKYWWEIAWDPCKYKLMYPHKYTLTVKWKLKNDYYYDKCLNDMGLLTHSEAVCIWDAFGNKPSDYMSGVIPIDNAFQELCTKGNITGTLLEKHMKPPNSITDTKIKLIRIPSLKTRPIRRLHKLWSFYHNISRVI